MDRKANHPTHMHHSVVMMWVTIHRTNHNQASFLIGFGQVGDCCELLMAAFFVLSKHSLLHMLSCLSLLLSWSLFTLGYLFCPQPSASLNKDLDCPFASHHSQHGLNRASDKCPPLPCLINILSAERVWSGVSTSVTRVTITFHSL